MRKRKIGRLGNPRHIGVAPRIHRDAKTRLRAAAAQVSGVGQRERVGPGVKAQLADEDVIDSSQGAVGKQRVRERKIARKALPRHVGVAPGVHRDGSREFVAAAAQISRVNQG